MSLLEGSAISHHSSAKQRWLYPEPLSPPLLLHSTYCLQAYFRALIWPQLPRQTQRVFLLCFPRCERAQRSLLAAVWHWSWSVHAQSVFCSLRSTMLRWGMVKMLQTIFGPGIFWQESWLPVDSTIWCFNLGLFFSFWKALVPDVGYKSIVKYKMHCKHCSFLSFGVSLWCFFG